MTWILLIITVIGGILAGFQSSINGVLGTKIGALEASLFSFLVGSLALSLIVIFFGKGNLLIALSQPKWQLVGGLCGAFFVVAMVLAVPKLGVASALVAVIAGQILASTIIDHFGLFGGRHIPIDWQRSVGLVLLATALILFYKK